MTKFLEKSGFPVFVVQACVTSQKENTDVIPRTLAIRPHSHAVKSIILKLTLMNAFHLTNLFLLLSLPIPFSAY